MSHSWLFFSVFSVSIFKSWKAQERSRASRTRAFSLRRRRRSTCWARRSLVTEASQCRIRTSIKTSRQVLQRRKLTINVGWMDCHSRQRSCWSIRIHCSLSSSAICITFLHKWSSRSLYRNQRKTSFSQAV